MAEASLDVFWTWCDGSCAGSEKLGVWGAAIWFMAQGSGQEGAGWRRLEELARQQGAGCIGDLAWPNAAAIDPGVVVLAR